MDEVYVSRYLHQRGPEAVRGLTCRPGLGPSFRVHEWLWLVPVTVQKGGRMVMSGQLRVMAVSGGKDPVCELLLVGELIEAGACDPEHLLDDLVAGLEHAYRLGVVTRFAKARDRMVRRDLRPRGIADAAVLVAMAEVPRERFLPENYGHAAYDDRALPIAGGQTISQPFIVAAMAQAAQVRPGDRVLEIGTGSGYGAAVLAHLGAEVTTVERDGELAAAAAGVLAEISPGVEVVVADGSLGWPDGAPYDAIVVTAAAPRVPEALVDQLAEGGRLVLPVGTRHGAQHLRRLTKQPDGALTEEDFGLVAFVPLVGDQGF